MPAEYLISSFKYLTWQELYNTEKPFQIFINIPDDAKDQRSSNLVFEEREVRIEDVRGQEDKFHIDKQGFMYRKHCTKVKDFTNRKVVDDNYLPEVKALLERELEGVDQVFFFDWRLRKDAPHVQGAVQDLNDLTSWLRPANHVHIDQSPAAALKRIQLQMGDEASWLLKGRVRIINVWRPLINSVENWSLAVCDGSGVAPEEFIEADHVRRQYQGSTMYLTHNPSHKFYYMSKQSRDDVLIFKNFDSRSSVLGRYAPHASFRHPNPPENAEPRQSIEVRALVFTWPVGVERALKDSEPL